MDNRYISTAVMRVDVPGEAAAVAERLNRLQTDVLSRTSLSEIIMKDDLYKRQASADRAR